MDKGGLDGSEKAAADHRRGSGVPNVRRDYVSQAVRQKAGRSFNVQAPGVLQPTVHGVGHDQGESHDIGAPMARKKAAQAAVRSVRGKEKVAGPPRGSKPKKQQAGKHSNAVQELPQFLARDGAQAGEDHGGKNAAAFWGPGWEDGVPRTIAPTDPRSAGRRKRLIAIGNSLVPIIPQIIGTAIFEYEAAQAKG